MTYLTKDKRQIIIDIFSGVDVVRQRLTDAGYKFVERDVRSNGFWGTSFVIDRPTGKGSQRKLNFLFHEAAR